MGRNDPTVEEILRMIVRQDERALRDEQRLLSLFADYSRGKMAAQQRQLAIFCQCGGHTAIQKLRGASRADQQLGYHRLIQEMVDGYGLRREVALDIGGAYWRVALGTEPPEASSPRPTPPEPSPPKPQPEPKPVPPKPQPKPEPKPEPPKPQPEPKPQPPEKPKGKRGGRSPWLLVAVAVLAGAAFVFGKGMGRKSTVPTVPTTPSVSTVSTTPSAPAVSTASSRFDLTPFQLNEAVAKQIQEGTEDVYIYPDGSRMEFYFDGSGKEVCRVYISTEDRIENLFTMLYDSSGRLMMQELYDSQGTALRVDTYDFHSNESTAQHRIELSDGRFFQGISTFDADGGETFECFLGDGSKTVTQYDPNGLWIVRTTYDTSGAVTDESSIDDITPLYAVRNIPIGKAIDYGDLVYVWGLCGEPIKQYGVYNNSLCSYNVSIHDVLGNPLEQTVYNADGDMTLYCVWEYDENGSCLGYDQTSYGKIQDGVPQKRTVTHFNQDGVEISSMTYDADGNRLQWSETELNEAGREKQRKTYDDAGNTKSVVEWQYDQAGGLEKKVSTNYYESGQYSVVVSGANKKIQSAIRYFPNGQIYLLSEYDTEGEMVKRTIYNENGAIDFWYENVFDTDGKRLEYIRYNGDGTIAHRIKSIYDTDGNEIESRVYNADGTLDSSTQTVYGADGRRIRSTTLNGAGNIISWEEYSYNSDGRTGTSNEYNAAGKLIAWNEYTYNADGTVADVQYHEAE